jgi:hypothetical protein
MRTPPSTPNAGSIFVLSVIGLGVADADAEADDDDDTLELVWEGVTVTLTIVGTKLVNGKSAVPT